MTFREYRGGALELCILCADFGAPDVGVDDELTDVVGGFAFRDVCEHFMKKIELMLPILVLDDAPVFPQTSEVEVASDGRRYDKWGLARGRRQLLEVLL